MPRVPRVGADRIVRALRKGSFVDYRQKGSHLTLVHTETGRNVTVPMHGGVLSVGLVHTIIKQAGLTVEEFIELLR